MTKALGSFSLAAALTVGTALSPLPTLAQQDASESGGMLVSFLEETLSDDSRTIHVEGLEGAFSSQARIALLTVSDEDGVWLTVKGAELDWNRLALIQGRFSVNHLTADDIIIDRRPKPLPADPSLPMPEATPFSLPELPVSLEIGDISANKLSLGATLTGQAASLSLKGDITLADGALDTDLRISRLDRPGDRLTLTASFANDTEQLALDLALAEAAGGLVSTALDLPGRPNLNLAIKGTGPLADFTADIGLSTNGRERISGSVALAGLSDVAAGADAGLAFSANLGGNIDPLLKPDYRPFFGPGLRATLKGQTLPGGGLELDSLALRSRALQLTGALTITGGDLQTANLRAGITPPKGQAAVLLPIPGAEATVAKVTLTAQKAEGADWTIDGFAKSLSTPEVSMARAVFTASGSLNQSAGFDLDGRLEAELSDFVLTDPALAAAAGRDIALNADLSTRSEDDFLIRNLDLQGDRYQALGDIRFNGVENDLRIDTDLKLSVEDISRYSRLSGQALSGAAAAMITGHYQPLSGAFGLELSLTGQDLGVGHEQVDPLLAGESQLTLVAARDSDGIRVDRFALETAELTANGHGDLDSGAGRVQLTARLARLERLVPDLPGSVTLTADFDRMGERFDGKVQLRGPRDIALDLDGRLTLSGEADLTVDASFGAPEVFVPQLAGAPLIATGKATRRDGVWQAQGSLAGQGDGKMDVTGQFTEATGAAELHFDTVVQRLQKIIPELEGILTAKGDVSRSDGIWTLETTAKGPLGIDSRVAGTWDEAKSLADLTAKGSLRLEGANAFLKPNLVRGVAQFDLALRGPAALRSLTGTITTSDAQLVLPEAAQSIDAITTRVTLNNGTATLSLNARPRDGGRVEVSGPVSLSAPYSGTLQISLADVVLTDNLSYTTSLGGQLQLSGPLTGNSSLSGRVDIGETNINLNTAGGAVSAAPIPPIRHIGQSRAQIATRSRAGLINTGPSGGGKTDIALNILISAPNRIFARGRGLNAELGGAITLRGTTSSLAPAGQISLIRGTFDILGRRLTLNEGRITLLGDLKPYLKFSSSATTEQGTATLEISGPMDSPQIQVTSEPARPSEEALALLLFGDNIQDISPLALARLASSALTLSGRGGGTQKALRKGTGADNVDIGANNLGVGQLGLGGYLADNVYTDLNVTTEGDSELTINLDLTKSLTVTGKADSAGGTGIGLFYKRDY